MSLAKNIYDAGYEAIAVAGPTASGKTSLAIELARRLGGEIISCDSMQIYKGMDIATAKATEKERAAVPHHLIDICPLSVNYSAADYVSDATKAARDIIGRGRLPVFCGGTGLYLESVMRGEYPQSAKSDTALREQLLLYASEHGNDALHDMLRSIDPVSADAIHKNNIKRVVRAIEIAKGSGITKTELDGRHREFRGLKVFAVCLCFEQRQLLYSRIDNRVEEMVKSGLCEELEQLMRDPHFLSNKTAIQAIGYKEFFAYIRGDATLEECKEQLKTATRRYAKRQLTWFRGRDYVHCLYADRDGKVKDVKELADEFTELLRSAKRV